MNKIKLKEDYIQINGIIKILKIAYGYAVEEIETLSIRTWPICNLRNSKKTSKRF